MAVTAYDGNSVVLDLVSSFEWGTRASNVFKRLGTLHLGEIFANTSEHLLEVKNCSFYVIDSIEKALGDLNLSLPDKPITCPKFGLDFVASGLYVVLKPPLRMSKGDALKRIFNIRADVIVPDLHLDVPSSSFFRSTYKPNGAMGGD